MIKRGWVAAEDKDEERDPLRASAERLEATFLTRPLSGIKLKKSERELLAFLELHPGAHNVAELSEKVKKRARARARWPGAGLSRSQQNRSYRQPVSKDQGPILNRHQQAAFEAIEQALEACEFKAFLLEGVTGSGKTEVYMRAIEATRARGRNALLLVPEIALTPAVAGQFFHRFGPRSSHSAFRFGDAERAGQWRRIRNGQARVVIGTRSGVFAPRAGSRARDHRRGTRWKL